MPIVLQGESASDRKLLSGIIIGIGAVAMAAFAYMDYQPPLVHPARPQFDASVILARTHASARAPGTVAQRRMQFRIAEGGPQRTAGGARSFSVPGCEGYRAQDFLRPGDGEPHPLLVPTRMADCDLLLVEADCTKLEPDGPASCLHVEVSRAPAGATETVGAPDTWVSLSPRPRVQGLGHWYRFESPTPFRHARISLSGQGPPVEICQVVAFEAQSPHGLAPVDGTPVRLAALHGDQAILKDAASTALCLPTRCLVRYPALDLAAVYEPTLSQRLAISRDGLWTSQGREERINRCSAVLFLELAAGRQFTDNWTTRTGLWAVGRRYKPAAIIAQAFEPRTRTWVGMSADGDVELQWGRANAISQVPQTHLRDLSDLEFEVERFQALYSTDAGLATLTRDRQYFSLWTWLAGRTQGYVPLGRFSDLARFLGDDVIPSFRLKWKGQPPFRPGDQFVLTVQRASSDALSCANVTAPPDANNDASTFGGDSMPLDWWANPTGDPSSSLVIARRDSRGVTVKARPLVAQSSDGTAFIPRSMLPRSGRVFVGESIVVQRVADANSESSRIAAQ